MIFFHIFNINTYHMTIIYKSNSITITKNKNDFVLSYDNDDYTNYWKNTMSQLESYKQSQNKNSKQIFLMLTVLSH